MITLGGDADSPSPVSVILQRVPTTSRSGPGIDDSSEDPADPRIQRGSGPRSLPPWNDLPRTRREQNSPVPAAKSLAFLVDAAPVHQLAAWSG